MKQILTLRRNAEHAEKLTDNLVPYMFFWLDAQQMVPLNKN